MLTCLFLSDAMCTTDRCILFILLLFSVLNKDLLFIMPALLHFLHRNTTEIKRNNFVNNLRQRKT
jgi:hypothetical protein